MTDERVTVEFFGDNARFGAEKVELSAERFVGLLEDEGEDFPFGVRGLLPVVTVRKKKGGYKTVYAFPFTEGTEPANAELAQELSDALGFINLLLREATEASGHDFGQIGGIWLSIAEKGYGFTRVEQVLSDGPNGAPIHLRVETSDKPGAPGTLSAVIEYDFDGYVRNVLMTEYAEDGYSCYASAAIDFASGEIVVQKVAETPSAGAEAVELYRRRRRVPRYEGDTAGRDERWYDRR